jgi:hypothetical protein
MPLPEPDVGSSKRLALMTSWSCPYSQRVEIALHEKGVPHDVVEIALDAKPDWFTRYSAYGLTPAFIVPYGESGQASGPAPGPPPPAAQVAAAQTVACLRSPRASLPHSPAWPEALPACPPAPGSQQRGVFHNIICNEFLEEAYPNRPPLLPKHPVDRAAARVYVDAVANKTVPAFYRAQLATDPQERQELMAAVDAELRCAQLRPLWQ